MNIIKVLVIVVVANVVIPSFAQSNLDAKIEVVDFARSTCEKVFDPGMITTRIIDRYFENNLCVITVGVLGTCCVSHRPFVNFKSNVLYLDYREFGEECDCKCYYEFTYKISGLEKSEFGVLFKGETIEISREKYRTFPIQFRLMDGDTVNLTDKYGMKQGMWTFDSAQITKFYVFKNNVPVKQVELYPDGKVHRETVKEYGNWNYHVEYYENGRKRIECFNGVPEEFYKEGMCKKWNIDGELIYEGPYDSLILSSDIKD